MKKIKDRDYEEYQQYLYNTAHAYIWTPSTLDFICRGNDYDPEKIGKQLLEVYAKLKNEHISHMTSDKRRKYVIRSLRKSETELLKDFLYEAIFIPEGVEPPAKDIVEKPELRVYTEILSRFLRKIIPISNRWLPDHWPLGERQVAVH